MSPQREDKGSHRSDDRVWGAAYANERNVKEEASTHILTCYKMVRRWEL